MNLPPIAQLQWSAPPARIAPNVGNPTGFMQALQQAGAGREELAPVLDDRRIQSLAQMVRMILAQTDRALLSMAPEMGNRLPENRLAAMGGMGGLGGMGGMNGLAGLNGWPSMPMAVRPPLPGMEEVKTNPTPASAPLAPPLATDDGLTPHTSTPAPEAASAIQSIIHKAAERYGVDEKLIASVIRTESDFNPQAVSRVGAQGLMQLMPATAKELGVNDAFDPEQNVMGGTRYLKRLLERYNGDRNLALAAYNWGMGNLERNPNEMPSETRNYVAKINRLLMTPSTV